MDDKEPLPALNIADLDTLKIEPLSKAEIDTLIGNFSSINVDDIITTSSLDNTMSGTFSYSTAPYGNITISTGATGSNGSYLYSGSGGSTNWGTLTSTQPSLHVSGAAEFEGDIKVKGVSVLETLQKIEKRLAILRPDPEKLKHFEALKKAYEHYKTLEALCELPEEEE